MQARVKLSAVLAAVIAAAAVAALAAPALAGPVEAHASATKKVQIGDNYYLPKKLKVKKGTTVTWNWPDIGDTHDVKLSKGPKGAKKFKSAEAAAEFKFAQKLKVPGKYDIVCTLHKEMTMTITVGK